MQFQLAKNHILARLRQELPSRLSYHSTAHIQDVYQAAERLAAAEGITGNDLILLLTAAMYHDCGFMVQSKDHEKIGCDIVRQTLPQFGYTAAQIERICGMIMATQVPQTPHNHLEEVICDADLDYLGREDFNEIGHRLFLELQDAGVVSNQVDWKRLQIRFLSNHHYFTQTAINTRKQKKEQYLADIQAKLND